MAITVRFETLLKRAAGTDCESVTGEGPLRVEDVIREVAARRGEPLKSLLLDPVGKIRASVLIFVDDGQCSATDARELREGDVVTLMAPISGG